MGGVGRRGQAGIDELDVRHCLGSRWPQFGPICAELCRQSDSFAQCQFDGKGNHGAQASSLVAITV
jgi:hypothetical protein